MGSFLGLRAPGAGVDARECGARAGQKSSEKSRIFVKPVLDVALVDIGLPGMSGIEGIKRFKERYPNIANIAPLVLTVYGDDARIFAALCAGACGYLLKKTPPARLLEPLGVGSGRESAENRLV